MFWMRFQVSHNNTHWWFIHSVCSRTFKPYIFTVCLWGIPTPYPRCAALFDHLNVYHQWISQWVLVYPGSAPSPDTTLAFHSPDSVSGNKQQSLTHTVGHTVDKQQSLNHTVGHTVDRPENSPLN